MTDPKKKQMRAAERFVKKLEPWRLAEIRYAFDIPEPKTILGRARAILSAWIGEETK